ncbi:hypothetical protein GGI25_004869 [Coemansia spiralis]|uniref:TPR-like protein n=2 Tax=Coemansia TaxID=4863 RepID=A0A9W8KWN4_9FUNG|nr:hypothetical protein BX070DRAFT_234530 [Coemansia spiralis]KAJ1991938.1 hypothetical protein EDC05_003092 [Coemansia umbellata]KAJ2625309.1 hypothetical protein GGI26_000779 [Coemansia sp. RSA 1358]KAJ2673054.1 hypothetical protein GGI25_004869 [Coemansia spiralis]
MSADSSEKRKEGLSHKEAGNRYFKANEFSKALKEYHYALLHLRGLNSDAMNVAKPRDPETMTEDEVTEQDKELSAISSNIAACHMRLQRYDRVVFCANEALKTNPFNKKAKFRLAQGYVREGALGKASKLLDELEKDSPNDQGFAAERRNIELKEKQAEEKQRKEFAGMFDRSK